MLIQAYSMISATTSFLRGKRSLVIVVLFLVICMLCALYLYMHLHSLSLGHSLPKAAIPYEENIPPAAPQQ